MSAGFAERPVAVVLGKTTLGGCEKPIAKPWILVCLLSDCWHSWSLSHFGSSSIRWLGTAIAAAACRQVQPTAWQMRPTAEVIIYWEFELGHHAVALCWQVRSASAHFFQIWNDFFPKDMHKKTEAINSEWAEYEIKPSVGYHPFQEWKTKYSRNTAHTRGRKAGALWNCSVVSQLFKINPFDESREGPSASLSAQRPKSSICECAHLWKCLN